MVHPLTHALAVDPHTPASTITLVVDALGDRLGAPAGTPGWPSITAELATHPNRPPGAHPILDETLTEIPVLHHALTRVGVDDTHRSRACDLAGTTTLLGYLDFYADAHPFAATRAAGRNPLPVDVARIVATHPASASQDQTRALATALAHPAPTARRTELLITSATLHPEELAELTELAVYPFRDPLERYGATPDPYQARVQELTDATRKKQSRPSAWAAAIGSSGDSELAERALDEHGSTATSVQPIVRAILSTPRLHGTRAYTRAKLLTIRYAHMRPQSNAPLIPVDADEDLLTAAAQAASTWVDLGGIRLRDDLSSEALEEIWDAAVRLANPADARGTPGVGSTQPGTYRGGRLPETALVVLAHPAVTERLRAEAHQAVAVAATSPWASPADQSAGALADVLARLGSEPRADVAADIPVPALTLSSDPRVRAAASALALAAFPDDIHTNPAVLVTLLRLAATFTGTVGELLAAACAISG